MCKILFVADTHNRLRQAEYYHLSGDYDAIISLGDVSYEDYMVIKKIWSGVPIYGVLGNHEDINTLTRAGITPLQDRVIRIGDLTFTGMNGAFSYKSTGTGTLLLQEESRMVAEYLPHADVFITHSNAYEWSRGKSKKHYDKKSTHEGLLGIRDYIRKNHCRIHIHGHLHEDYTKKHLFYKEVCIYGFKEAIIEGKDIKIVR